jgi:cyclopropane fatty-acyl-phospholipid synthase-like methyltransferase
MKDLFLIQRYYQGLKNKILITLRFLICPFPVMEKTLPVEGKILDIGCGEGGFSCYLAVKSRHRGVFGIDLNGKKIALAQTAADKIKNVKFKIFNGLEWSQKVDAVIISDAFHHLSPFDQEKLLNNIYQILKSGGRLVIKEINKDDKIRAPLSRLWDFLLYPGDRIHYWSSANLSKRLREIGFEVSYHREALLFPGSTIVYVCIKR